MPRIDQRQEDMTDIVLQAMAEWADITVCNVKGPTLAKDNLIEIAIEAERGRFDTYQITVVKKR